MFTFNMVRKELFQITRSYCKSSIRFKSFSSRDWMARRKNDIYIEKARQQHYRCRSAFKLIEIDDKYKIIKPGFCVVDVGASPGSWSQVFVKRTNADGSDKTKHRGAVISVDRNPIFHIPGATVLPSMDFTEPNSQKQIVEAFEWRKPHIVASDMSPNATGVKDLDQQNSYSLAYSVLVFAVLHSLPKATCLVKMWQSDKCDVIIREMERFYNKVNYAKPDASQTDSAEIYLLARDFKGLQRNLLGDPLTKDAQPTLQISEQ